MLFAENGIPKYLQCDNGAQFTSGEFQQLASQYGFEIVTSSPQLPTWPWIRRTTSPNGQEDDHKMQRN